MGVGERKRLRKEMLQEDSVLNVLDQEALRFLKNAAGNNPATYKRRPFPWYGGKGSHVTWLLRLLPNKGYPSSRQRVYVEPFAGGAGVFWALPVKWPIEVLNDLDLRVVTTFRVLQDERKSRSLLRKLVWTPYAREEFNKALEIIDRPDMYKDMDVAWATIVAFACAISATPKTTGNWARALTDQNRTYLLHNRVPHVLIWHNRLVGVQIERRDALEVMEYYDSKETLFYVDPPYVPATRSSKNTYSQEMSIEHHRRLVDVLLSLKGRCVLSGYAHKVYEPLERSGWRRVDVRVPCMAQHSNRRDDGRPVTRGHRVESVWLSPNCAK